ncbi:MAG: hypothetical protein K1W24_02990 [Lachnospiraceae bacterium]
MAQRYENQCVDCGLPCMYGACRNYNVKVLECDCCNDEVDKLYIVGDKELCAECALDKLEVVE